MGADVRAKGETMTEAERKRRPCAACGKPVGLATIVCGGDFPDAPLCFTCAEFDPFEEIPTMIRNRRAALLAATVHAMSGDGPQAGYPDDEAAHWPKNKVR